VFSKKNDRTAASEIPMSSPNLDASRRPASALGQKAPLSIFSPGTVIEGVIHSTGDLQIDGTLIGDVRCASLSIGATGEIRGDIIAESVSVRGSVTGSIRGRTVHLASGGKIEGDVTHAQLTIDAGGLFDGRSRREPDPIASVAPLQAIAAPKAVSETTDDDAIAIPALR